MPTAAATACPPAATRGSLPAVLAVLLAFLVPQSASAGGAAPTTAPALDPADRAHVAITEEPDDLVTPRRYALGGTFVGDLDGDGRDDFALPAGLDNRIELFFGTPLWGQGDQDSPSSGGDSSLELPEGCRDSSGRIQVVGLGDVDGDGRDDLGVACPQFQAVTGSGTVVGGVGLHWGRSDYPSTIHGLDRILVGRPVEPASGAPTSGDILGTGLAALGDIDGDSFSDFGATGLRYDDPAAPPAFIFLGGPEARSELRDHSDARWVLRPAADQRCLSELSIGPLGDVDGDDFADLALSCLEQPAPPAEVNAVDVQWSAFLGGALREFPPGAYDLANRSFGIFASTAAPARAFPGAALGDLDGDGFGDFALLRFAEGSSLVSARTILGHAPPWSDIDLYVPGRDDPLEAIDRLPWWTPGGTATAMEALGLCPAPDLDGDGRRDLWIRSGLGASAGVGLLTEIDPERWADSSTPPFELRFSTPGGVSVSTPARVALGGVGDANGDGISDLLLTSGWSDGGGCTAAVCGGAWLILCIDGDGDGVGVCAGDCDDLDPAVRPGIAEVCDAADHDCDGLAGELDSDADGVRACDGDCDDADPSVSPTAAESCDSPGDVDCDGGAPDEDLDGDGARHCEDCQPWIAAMAPGAAEECDGLDGNCDGRILRDEQDPDRDGAPRCTGAGPGDCDDRRVSVGPHHAEDCTDGRDDDCDGAIDENEDADGDGVRTCQGDCDDSDPLSFPGVAERCNGLDDDCDGVVDDAPDEDGDGADRCLDCADDDPQVAPGLVGTCDGTDRDCVPGSDVLDRDGDFLSACGGDCDDGRPDRRPGLMERCDRVDNNCNGVADEPFDADLDGFATCHGDCNDGSGTQFPAGFEPNCDDGEDGDCDGEIDSLDSDCPTTWSPPPQVPVPYGLGCVAPGGSAALLGLLVGVRRRRAASFRGPSAHGRARLRGAILLGFALAVAGPAVAWSARPEKAVVVYLASHPDVGAMGKAKSLARGMAVEVVEHAGEMFGAPPPHPIAYGVQLATPCDGARGMDLGTASAQALDRLIELDHSNAEALLDQAIAAIQCLDRPLSPRQLAELHYHRAVARVALRKYPMADEDFRSTLAYAPDFPGDPNFPPEVNGRLADLRSEVKARSPVHVDAYAPPGSRVSIDGRDLDTRVGADVLPGRHFVQFLRNKAVHGILIDVAPGDAPFLVLPTERARALRDAQTDATARRFAALALGRAADEAELDLVAVVDLEVEGGKFLYAYRASSRAFSFEAEVLTVSKGGGARSAPSSPPASGARAAGGAAPTHKDGGRATTGEPSTAAEPARGASASKSPEASERPTRDGVSRSSPADSKAGAGVGTTTAQPSPARPARGGALSELARRNLDRRPMLAIRVLGAWQLARPWHYAAVGVDLSWALVGGLRLDAGLWLGSPGKGTWGWVTQPVGQIGGSWQFETPHILPRIGAVAQVSVDRSTGATRARAGFAVRGGADVPIPASPVIVAFDVQGGMLGLGTPYLAAGGGVGVRF